MVVGVSPTSNFPPLTSNLVGAIPCGCPKGKGVRSLKEIIKSITLGFLVLTSLGLTFILWYGTPAHEISRPLLSERIHFTNPRTLSEIILPARMVVHLGTEAYHLLSPGQDLYNSVITVFNKHFAEQIVSVEEIAPDEWAAALEGEGVLLYYAYPISFETDAAGLTENSIFASKVFLSGKDKNSHLAFQSQAGLFFQTEDLRGNLFDYELHNQLFLSETAAFFRRAEEEDIPIEGVFLAGDIYIPLETISMSALMGKTARVEIERLKKVFFADLSLVRRIEEKDGAVIYTDGRKGLRVYVDGAIEYTSAVITMEALPLNEQALRLAGEVVALYGGWEENLQLWLPPRQETMGASGQKVLFRSFFQGKPFVSREGCLNLVLTERGVQSFFRRLVSPWQPEGEGAYFLEVILAEEALLKSIDYLLQEKHGQVKIGLTDFYLAYYRREPEGEISHLVPVWVLETDVAGMVLINAHTGLFLDRLVFD